MNKQILFYLLTGILILGTFAISLTATNYSPFESGINFPNQIINKYNNGFIAFDSDVSDKNTLSVSGSSTIFTQPDEIEISLSMVTEDPSAQKSQQKNAELAQKVRQALLSSGLKESDIETTSYNLNFIREWDSRQEKYIDKGFRTTHSLLLTINDIDSAGKIIDTAVNSGANNVNYLSFTLSDEKLSELRLQALKEAGENAKTKAETIADSLDVSLAQIIQITDNSGYYPVSRSYPSAYDSGIAEKITTEISPSDVSVSASISVVYEIN